MARNFDGTTQYLESTATPPAVGPPLSVAAWFNPSSTGSIEIIGGVSRATGTTQSLSLGLSPAGLVGAQSQSGGTSRTALSSAAAAVSAWNHGLAVFSANNSRSVYLNGGSKGTNTQNNSPAGVNRTNIGARYLNAAVASFFPGDIAEVAMWNVALTDADALILSKGIPPYLVKGESLVCYWPLLGRYSPEISLLGGFDLTLANAPAVAVHPPMRYAASPPKPQLRHIAVQTTQTLAAIALGVVTMTLLFTPGPVPPPSEGGGGGTAAFGGTGLGSTKVYKQALRWGLRTRKWPVRP